MHEQACVCDHAKAVDGSKELPIVKRHVVLSLATTLAVGLSIPLSSAAASTASAHVTPRPASHVVTASGPTPNSGFVAIPLSGVTPNTCTSPQGVGDSWCYGTSVSSDGTKTCYSNYTHPTKYHSATAQIASSTKKSYAQAGNTANATAYGGSGATCYTYWNVY